MTLPALLLTCCLQIGDWQRAQTLMRWLRALGLADFAAFPSVGRAICEWLPLQLRWLCSRASNLHLLMQLRSLLIDAYFAFAIPHFRHADWA